MKIGAPNPRTNPERSILEKSNIWCTIYLTKFILPKGGLRSQTWKFDTLQIQNFAGQIVKSQFLVNLIFLQMYRPNLQNFNSC